MEECTIEANFNLPKVESKESEDLNSCSNSDVRGPPRSCTECHTTRTPLWRGGPAGPRSLCNACGIRSRKKRKALMDLNEERSCRKKKSFISSSSKFEVCSSKLEFMAINRKVLEKRKLREEERAAIMLMALSCGFLFAFNF